MLRDGKGADQEEDETESFQQREGGKRHASDLADDESPPCKRSRALSDGWAKGQLICDTLRRSGASESSQRSENLEGDQEGKDEAEIGEMINGMEEREGDAGEGDTLDIFKDHTMVSDEARKNGKQVAVQRMDKGEAEAPQALMPIHVHAALSAHQAVYILAEHRPEEKKENGSVEQKLAELPNGLPKLEEIHVAPTKQLHMHHLQQQQPPHPHHIPPQHMATKLQGSVWGAPQSLPGGQPSFATMLASTNTFAAMLQTGLSPPANQQPISVKLAGSNAFSAVLAAGTFSAVLAHGQDGKDKGRSSICDKEDGSLDKLSHAVDNKLAHAVDKSERTFNRDHDHLCRHSSGGAFVTMLMKNCAGEHGEHKTDPKSLQHDHRHHQPHQHLHQQVLQAHAHVIHVHPANVQASQENVQIDVQMEQGEPREIEGDGHVEEAQAHPNAHVSPSSEGVGQAAFEGHVHHDSHHSDAQGELVGGGVDGAEEYGHTTHTTQPHHDHGGQLQHGHAHGETARKHETAAEIAGQEAPDLAEMPDIALVGQHKVGERVQDDKTSHGGHGELADMPSTVYKVLLSRVLAWLEP